MAWRFGPLPAGPFRIRGRTGSESSAAIPSAARGSSTCTKRARPAISRDTTSGSRAFFFFLSDRHVKSERKSEPEIDGATSSSVFEPVTTAQFKTQDTLLGFNGSKSKKVFGIAPDKP